jgi:membrane-bound inhibitor of C-type lysozyme
MLPLPLLALCVAACSGDRATATATDAAPPAPVPTSDTRAYRCSDGTMLQADYVDDARGDVHATLRWADGRSATLPRAESASAAGGDAYVGEHVSLQRTGSDIVLHDGDAPALACEEVEAETVTYACEADTRVTVLADGSAHVALPDGRAVDLSRVAGSMPPVYSGDSLYLTVDDDGAHLSQEDAARELACKIA